MKLHRPLVALLAAFMLMLGSQVGVLAHPLGNFSVNHYTRVEVGPEGARARYVLDLAEIPTLQELRAAGVQSGRPDPAQHDAVLRAKIAELIPGVQLSVDGRPITWQVQEATLELVPGQADLDTMRVVIGLTAPQPLRVGAQVAYRDATYPGRIGWHEVVLRGADGFGLQGSAAPATDETDELRSYPLDPTRAPLDITNASGQIVLGGNAAVDASPATGRGGAARFAVDPRTDYLASFLKGSATGPLALLVALVAAAGLGGLHALEPGHGKTIVGGYLVGSRGTPRQAVILGLTVTATHTIGVYLLGLVTLVAAQFIVPDRLYPILGAVSGLCVVGIGLGLLRTRLGPLVPTFRRQLLPLRSSFAFIASPMRVASLSPEHTPAFTITAPSVIYPELHARRYANTAGQDSGGHDQVRDDDHSHDQSAHAVTHRHGSGPLHTHTVPGADGQGVTARNLLALGVSGGLLPCPSALVVLLAAISFGNIALGMALVAAFSVGLAGVLTGLGLLVVFGGRALGRFPVVARLGASPLAGALPVVSAAIITVAGIGITLQAVGAWV